jgi:hypothetical protein
VLFGAGALNGFAAFPSVRAEAASRLRVVSHEPLGDDVASTYAVGET